jgi:hypothetical protein
MASDGVGGYHGRAAWPPPREGPGDVSACGVRVGLREGARVDEGMGEVGEIEDGVGG